MKRKDFLKKTTLAGFVINVMKNEGNGTGNCTPTPEETEGPFSTHNPASLISQKIMGDRTGTPLRINITINNLNRNCQGLKDAIVDVWHCDSKGEYSEYGGKNEHGHMGRPEGNPMPPPGHKPGDSLSRNRPPHMQPPMGGGSMQMADHVNEHFLRGRQVTDEQGIVSFHSIYPGWYSGRAPHIHVHVFDAKGKSLLITQIAFPEEVCREVYSQGVYAAHGMPDTTNLNDMVFSDSIANELGTLTGNMHEGYTLSHAIYLKA